MHILWNICFLFGKIFPARPHEMITFYSIAVSFFAVTFLGAFPSFGKRKMSGNKEMSDRQEITIVLLLPQHLCTCFMLQTGSVWSLKTCNNYSVALWEMQDPVFSA